jgi:hypothetical protein
MVKCYTNVLTNVLCACGILNIIFALPNVNKYKELSRKNKENSLKATNPHHLGSHGYASKMDEFESELEELERLGIVPKTTDWELRLVHYYMVRGYTSPWTGALAPLILP